MEIKEKFDLTELLKERIEAIEDLNCEELYECIEAFIYATSYLCLLEDMNARAKYTSLRNDTLYRDYFYSFREDAQVFIDKIDELTLKSEDVE